jgi:hypothetical protein
MVYYLSLLSVFHNTIQAYYLFSSCGIVCIVPTCPYILVLVYWIPQCYLVWFFPEASGLRDHFLFSQLFIPCAVPQCRILVGCGSIYLASITIYYIVIYREKVIYDAAEAKKTVITWQLLWYIRHGDNNRRCDIELSNLRILGVTPPRTNLFSSPPPTVRYALCSDTDKNAIVLIHITSAQY